LFSDSYFFLFYLFTFLPFESAFRGTKVGKIKVPTRCKNRVGKELPKKEKNTEGIPEKPKKFPKKP
jgi:hypothetical protein